MPTYYVSAQTGNDSNNGLSAGAAKATLQAFVDKAIPLRTEEPQLGVHKVYENPFLKLKTFLGLLGVQLHALLKWSFMPIMSCFGKE